MNDEHLQEASQLAVSVGDVPAAVLHKSRDDLAQGCQRKIDGGSFLQPSALCPCLLVAEDISFAERMHWGSTSSTKAFRGPTSTSDFPSTCKRSNVQTWRQHALDPADAETDEGVPQPCCCPSNKHLGHDTRLTFATRSLPAKSTMCRLALVMTSLPALPGLLVPAASKAFEASTVMVRMACDLEESMFMRVSPVSLLLRATCHVRAGVRCVQQPLLQLQGGAAALSSHALSSHVTMKCELLSVDCLASHVSLSQTAGLHQQSMLLHTHHTCLTHSEGHQSICQHEQWSQLNLSVA